VKIRSSHWMPLTACALALAAAAASGQSLTHVPSANAKQPGLVAATQLSPELQQVVRAAGAYAVENPSAGITHYGYANVSATAPMVAAPNTMSNVEATKTEPDKNTYLTLPRQTGPDAGYDYGAHFLFQGHEAGSVVDPPVNNVNRQGAITRVNLDADTAHRVTVLVTQDVHGNPLPAIDGSTWYPFSQRLLLTAEFGNGPGGSGGGVWQATAQYPSQAEALGGILGRGGYEGIQADHAGNLWIVEDVGGAVPAAGSNARVANSFIYRFIPKNLRSLTDGGRLQVLQLASRAHAGAIVFDASNALTQDLKDLHTYGNVFATRWITIHDTGTDGFADFDANALAKLKSGTPFKRPENGVFRPGSGFREFFFTETGDTNATSTANAEHGGYGGIMKLTQPHPSSESGTLTLFFKGDREHTALDNIQFWSEHRVVAVEDRGDTLHAQGNGVPGLTGALDSAWLLDTRKDYAIATNAPVRIIAQGRDASATIDSALLGSAGYQNDGDNEITGIHVSDGDPGVGGLLGAKNPRPFRDGWRVFYTQQHGDNLTYEIIRAPQVGDEARHGERDDD
jgi:hypothetical protein